MGDIVKKWHFRPLKEVVYSVYGEKRARQIEYKARKQRESLAGVSTTAPLNVQVRLRAYCMIWELKQKYYKADTPLPYVSKASHKADEDKIKSLEARIIKGGSDEERAVKAVAEAKEYPQRRGKHSPLTEEKSRTVILQMMRRRSRSLGIILRPE